MDRNERLPAQRSSLGTARRQAAAAWLSTSPRPQHSPMDAHARAWLRGTGRFRCQIAPPAAPPAPQQAVLSAPCAVGASQAPGLPAATASSHPTAPCRRRRPPAMATWPLLPHHHHHDHQRQHWPGIGAGWAGPGSSRGLPQTGAEPAKRHFLDVLGWVGKLSKQAVPAAGVRSLRRHCAAESIDSGARGCGRGQGGR